MRDDEATTVLVGRGQPGSFAAPGPVVAAAPAADPATGTAPTDATDATDPARGGRLTPAAGRELPVVDRQGQATAVAMHIRVIARLSPILAALLAVLRGTRAGLAAVVAGLRRLAGAALRLVWAALRHTRTGLRTVWAALRHTGTGLRGVWAALRRSAAAALRVVWAALRHTGTGLRTVWAALRRSAAAALRTVSAALRSAGAALHAVVTGLRAVVTGLGGTVAGLRRTAAGLRSTAPRRTTPRAGGAVAGLRGLVARVGAATGAPGAVATRRPTSGRRISRRRTRIRLRTDGSRPPRARVTVAASTATAASTTTATTTKARNAPRWKRVARSRAVPLLVAAVLLGGAGWLSLSAAQRDSTATVTTLSVLSTPTQVGGMLTFDIAVTGIAVGDRYEVRVAATGHIQVLPVTSAVWWTQRVTAPGTGKVSLALHRTGQSTPLRTVFLDGGTEADNSNEGQS